MLNSGHLFKLCKKVKCLHLGCKKNKMFAQLVKCDDLCKLTGLLECLVQNLQKSVCTWVAKNAKYLQSC